MTILEIWEIWQDQIPFLKNLGDFALTLTYDDFPKSESASEKNAGNLSPAASQKILLWKALILLDAEHSLRHCTTLHSSFAQLAPKPEHMTEAQSSSQ